MKKVFLITGILFGLIWAWVSYGQLPAQTGINSGGTLTISGSTNTILIGTPTNNQDQTLCWEIGYIAKTTDSNAPIVLIGPTNSPCIPLLPGGIQWLDTQKTRFPVGGSVIGSGTPTIGVWQVQGR